MANEINIQYDTGATLTAKVRNAAGTQQGSDVSLTEVSTTGFYTGDMPAAGAGVYNVLVFDGTVHVGTGVIDWDGSAEITRADMVTATGFSTHSAPDLSNLDVAVSTRSSHSAPDLSNLDTTVSSRSSHSAADVWAVTTRTLSSFGTLIADIWSNATRTLSAFSFAVETDTASRTASQADVSALATAASITALNNLSAADVASELATYDGPTRAELTADKDEIITLINALNDFTLEEIGDFVLSRNVTNVETNLEEHTLGALILAILESSRTGNLWQIRRTNQTVAFSKTLTLDSSADPVTGVN